MENILVYILSISLLIQLFYYIFFFLRLSFFKHNNTGFKPDVSVIICAKNEIDNLRKNLPIILKQNYPNFELIVVNDQSTDDSRHFLKDLSSEYPQLKIVNISDNVKYRAGKKFALTLGIKSAEFEHLLLTDADCIPKSDNWISEMVGPLLNKDIVIGFGDYNRENSFLNRLIRFDTFLIAIQYFSYSLMGVPYMGVGRNLAYKKSLFFSNKGFASHIHLASGDDDLFIQEVANSSNIAICYNEEAHTTSSVFNSWSEWIHQKRRHIVTAGVYKGSLKILLGLWIFVQVTFWFSLVALFSLGCSISLLITILGLKVIVSFIIFYKPMRELAVKDLYLLHPLYEFFHLLVQGIFVLLNIFNKPKDW